MRLISRPTLYSLKRFGLLSIGILMVVGQGSSLLGETWTDKTGKFKVEATFEGIEGENVLLRKDDGATVTVPLNRLSTQSRSQANRLARSRSNTRTSEQSGASREQRSTQSNQNRPSVRSNSTSRSEYVPQPLSENFKSPPVPELSPSRTLASSPSLQEAYEHARDEVLAGHLLVLWSSLPDDLKTLMDDPDVCRAMVSSSEKDLVAMQEFQSLLIKLVEVLIEKKKFILGSQFLKQLPPNVNSDLRKNYDSIAGLVHEIVHLQTRFPDVQDVGVSQHLEYFLPRIGAHLTKVVGNLPPGMVDGFLSQIVVEQRDSNSGSISFPTLEPDATNSSGSTVVEFVRYEGQWLPKEFVDGWEEKKHNAKESLMAIDEIMERQNLDDPKLKNAMGVIQNVLNALANAKNQQEFDTQLQMVMLMLGPMLMQP